YFFFFSSRRRHTRSKRDWSSDVCSSDLQRSHGCSAAKHNLTNFAILRRLGLMRKGTNAENQSAVISHGLVKEVAVPPKEIEKARSEERRVGKECKREWSA